MHTDTPSGTVLHLLKLMTRIENNQAKHFMAKTNLTHQKEKRNRERSGSVVECLTQD